jgi:hypothetical protein
MRHGGTIWEYESFRISFYFRELYLDRYCDDSLRALEGLYGKIRYESTIGECSIIVFIGTKYAWYTDRGTYRIDDLSLSKCILFTSIDIRRDDSEWGLGIRERHSAKIFFQIFHELLSLQ